MEGRPRQVLEELQAAKVMRAAYSERQLDEVMVDFWMNHFNVFAGKGPEKFLVGAYERDVIRPHAWGKFEDLLKATAESPAMLFYLDNWLSADPDAAPPRMVRAAGFGRHVVTVRLAKGGRIVNGVGADTDIVVASAKAYVNALNKLQSRMERINPQV